MHSIFTGSSEPLTVRAQHSRDRCVFLIRMTVNCEATAYRDIFFFGLQKSPLSQHQRTIEDTKRLVTIKVRQEYPMDLG